MIRKINMRLNHIFLRPSADNSVAGPVLYNIISFCLDDPRMTWELTEGLAKIIPFFVCLVHRSWERSTHSKVCPMNDFVSSS